MGKGNSMIIKNKLFEDFADSWNSCGGYGCGAVFDVDDDEYIVIRFFKGDLAKLDGGWKKWLMKCERYRFVDYLIKDNICIKIPIVEWENIKLEVKLLSN